MSKERNTAPDWPPAATTDKGGRRGEVLTAAIRAFSARGYHQVSLREIADEIGITKAAIYYYFQTKQEILGEALAHAGKMLMDRIGAVVEQPLSPEEKLRAILVEHVVHLLEHRALYSVYFSDASELDATRREENLAGERWYATTVTSILEEGIEHGVFRRGVNPRVTTLAMLGMCNSTIRWFQPAHGLSERDVAEDLADMALSGIVSRPEGVL
jgi:AcrR family transcriptional regulator